MATTRETLLKIAALVNDEGTDEATRAVARLRLEEAYQRNPDLFAPPPSQRDRSDA